MEKVTTLYDTNSRDIPKTLLKIANSIENNDYGITQSAVLVIFNSDNKVEVFGLGDNNWFTSIALLEIGKQSLIHIEDSE